MLARLGIAVIMIIGRTQVLVPSVGSLLPRKQKWCEYEYEFSLS